MGEISTRQRAIWSAAIAATVVAVFMLSTMAVALPSITGPVGPVKDGDTVNIVFDADGNPNMTIELSQDGGSTWETTTVYNGPIPASPLPWTVAGGISSDECLLRITVSGAGGGSATSGTFTIDNTSPSFTVAPAASPASWTSGDSVTVTWTATDEAPNTGYTSEYRIDSADPADYTVDVSPLTLDVGGSGLNLADGVHVVDIRLTDGAGNTATSSVSIYIDKTAPDAFVPTVNPVGWTSDNSVEITFSTTDADSGIDHYEVALDGGAYTTQTSPYALDVTSVADGVHTVHVKAFDVAGNERGPQDVQIQLDKTAPDAFMATPDESDWTNADVNITFASADAGSGIDHYEVAIDGGVYAPATSPYAMSTEGQHVVHVKAVDAAGNETIAADVTTRIDKTDPEDFTPVLDPAGDWTGEEYIEVTFSTTDALSGISHYEMSVDGGAFTEVASPLYLDTTALPQGSHTVDIQAVDLAGNTRTKTVTLGLDTQVPDDFTPAANPPSWTNANSVTITFASADAGSGIDRYEVSVDGGAYSERTSPYVMDVSGMPDGMHMVNVAAIDGAGNERIKAVAIFLDKSSPVAFVPVANPANWTASNTVRFTFATTDACSGLNHYEVALDGGAYTTRKSPYLMSVLGVADGTHVVHVRAVDFAGNVTTQDVSIFLDKTRPAVFVPTVDPAGWTNDDSVVVTFNPTDAGSGIDHCEIAVDGGAYTTQTSPYTLDVSGLADGAHTVHVKAVDGVGNTRIADVTVSLDNVAPEDFTPTANPATWTNANTVDITFSTTDALSGIDHYEVALDEGAYTTQTSPYALDVTSVADGAHTVHVKAVDAAGNELIKDVTIQLDKTAAADFTPVADPASWTSSASVTITFDTTDAASGIDHFEVALDGGAYTTQTSPYILDVALVADGTHVVHVKAIDGSGNERIKDVNIYLDKTSPVVFALTSAAGWQNSDVSVSWNTTDATSGVDHYAVSYDGGAWASQTSPYVVSAEGTHTVSVKAVDEAGNERPATADATVQIDKTAPVAFTPTANPAGWTPANSVEITFSTTDATSGIDHYEVALDGGAYTAQTSPYALDVAAVADGVHTVHVKAIDAAGNETVGDVTISLDKLAPADFVPTANPAGWTNANSVQITFSTNDAGSGINHYEVALNGGAYATQTSPYALDVTSVADGTHTVHVKAIDNAGNERIHDVTISLDKAAPLDFTPVADPATWSNDNSVEITFATTDATSGVDHYEVALDDGAYSTQTSPYALDTTLVADGVHTVRVKAIDMAGNEQIETVAIYVDKSIMGFTPVADPASWTNANSVTITFSVADTDSGINHYEVALDGGAYTTQTSPYALDVTSVADGTHTVHVKAIDNAGNEAVQDVSIYLDKLAPADFTPVANPATWTNANTVEITFSTTDAGSGVNHYEVAVDGGAYATRTSPYAMDVAAIGDGMWVLHVKAIDNAGNERIHDVTISLDKADPEDFTPTADPATWTSANTVNITFAATDANSGIDHYEVALDGGAFATQTSPYALDVTSVADGTHTVHVKAIDNAGNELTKDVSIYLDKGGPADFTPTADPASWTNANTVNITFAATDAGSGIDHYEVALDGGAYTTQTSPYALDVTSVADGTHTVHVKAIDNSGNELIKDVSIYLDKTDPEDFTPAADPASWTNANTVNITWAANDALSGIAHYEVAVDGGAYAAQTSPYALDVTSVADGTHTVHVKAIDSAGNELVKDVTISLDNAAPSDFTPAASPPSWTNANTVNITFGTTDALSGVARYELALDGGAFATQTSSYALDVTSVADGTHTVHVKAIDNAGNELTKDVSIYLDKGGPADFTPTANPASWTNANTVNITFAATDAGSGIDHCEVALDGGAYTTQTSPYALDVTSVADGTHTVHVKAIDGSGNELIKDVSIYLDKTDPEDFTPAADPAGWTSANTVNITWAANDVLSGIAHYEVAVDGGAYAAQTSPYALDVTSVADGTHTVHVKAIDSAGNELVKDVTISLDNAAPSDFTPAASPPSWTNANTVNITFGTTDAHSGIARYELALDGGAFATQTSSYALDVTSVADGTHTVHVKAIDNAGNELTKDVSIYLDKGGPADFTPEANPASWTNANTVNITFAATDAGSGIDHYEVALDGGAYTTQTSPYALDVTSVADGTHTVHVKAIDGSGNELIKDVSIYLDKTDPEDFTPAADPAGWTSANTVNITWAANDVLSGIAHYEVAVDGGAYAAQTSPYALDVTSVADGTHTVHVKAIDSAGNELVKDVTISLDKTNPADFTPTADPSFWTNANTVNITFATTDAAAGVNHYEIAVDSGAYSTQTSPYALDVSAFADGTYVVHVKAIDNAGNEVVKDVTVYIDKGTPADFTPTADPASWTNENTVTITFASTDVISAINHYEVALDGGAYATQTSPYALDVTSVADGTHTVHVKAIDNGGNELVKDVSIYLDKGAPADFTPVADPASWTSANSVSITFSTTDALSGILRYEVQLDGGSYVSQESPYALDVTSVADGTHTVQVKAIDAAGNDLVRSVSIYIDKEGPADFTPTADPSSWTDANTVNITFATTDAGSGIDHFELALDGGAYATQTSPYALDVTSVADGIHTVHVKAIDNSGNELVKDVLIYLDKTDPADFIPTADPADWTNADTVNITFAATDADSGIDHYEIALDDGAYTTQTSPYALDVTSVADGSHTVHVKAIDNTGNERIKDVSIYLDKTDPEGFTPASDPAGWTNVNSVTITFATTDATSGLDYYEVALDDGDYMTATSPLTLDVSSAGDGTHTVHVRAVDAAGNEQTEDVPVLIDRTAPTALDLHVEDQQPALGRDFDYVLWKNWQGVTTLEQNTYHIVWEAGDADNATVALSYRPNATAEWTTLQTYTVGVASGEYSLDIRDLPESDSYQFRMVVTDSVGNSSSRIIAQFGLYDATKLAPTARVVAPVNGSVARIGTNANLLVSESMPVFSDPRYPSRAYKQSTPEWWYSGHALTASPRLSRYTKNSGGKPIGTPTILLSTMGKGTPSVAVNTDATQVSQYLTHVVTIPWNAGFVLKKGVVTSSHVLQVELRYSDVVSIGGVRQPDQPNRPGQVLPLPAVEPLIDTLKQYEYNRFYAR